MYAGLIALVSLTAGVLGAFGLLFTPMYAGPVPVPLGIVVTVLSLPWLIRAAGELDPRPWVAGAPLITWVVVVFGLGFTGPGGDVMLPPTWQSLLLVVGGIGSGLWSLRSVLLDENGPPVVELEKKEKAPVADAIPDRVIVGVLRPFVRATRPVLDGLREADPFGLRDRVRRPDDPERGFAEKVLDLLATVEVPGTAAWVDMDVDARSRWWVRRVGRFTTLVAAVPGIGGALANRLPVSKALGAAGQGLVLVAIAGEHGVHDEQTLVELLGTVLFRRDLAVVPLDDAADAEAEKQAEELTGDLADGDSTVKKVAGAVWRLGRALFALEGELDKRPHGNLFTEGLGMLPVVGAVGKYLGEWSGIREAAEEAQVWLRRPRAVPEPTPPDAPELR